MKPSGARHSILCQKLFLLVPMKKSEENLACESTTFESRLKRLQLIIERLETEDTSLEEALEEFESGIKISRQMQVTLENAEQAVRILLEGDGTGTSDIQILDDLEE